MAKVNICNVVVKDNPCPFLRPFQFEITFECVDDLNDDLEWKIIYVGSAESEEFDQTLDTVVVGPIVAGRHMFVFEADPPDVNKIPREDAVGVTVVLLTCSYRNQEFIRVGYYVNNEYSEPEMKESPPLEPEYKKLQRNILATCPRVTRFKIDWGDAEDSENLPPPANTENSSNQMAIDEEMLGAQKPIDRLEAAIKGETSVGGKICATNNIIFSGSTTDAGIMNNGSIARDTEPMQQ